MGGERAGLAEGDVTLQEHLMWVLALYERFYELKCSYYDYKKPEYPDTDTYPHRDA